MALSISVVLPDALAMSKAFVLLNCNHIKEHTQYNKINHLIVPIWLEPNLNKQKYPKSKKKKKMTNYFSPIYKPLLPQN